MTLEQQKEYYNIDNYKKVKKLKKATHAIHIEFGIIKVDGFGIWHRYTRKTNEWETVMCINEKNILMCLKKKDKNWTITIQVNVRKT